MTRGKRIFQEHPNISSRSSHRERREPCEYFFPMIVPQQVVVRNKPFHANASRAVLSSFAMLSIAELGMSYGNLTVFSGLSLAVQPGECVCVADRSGSGKSTLLRLLLGLEKPTEGKVEVDGVDLQALPPDVLQLYRRRIGCITQEPQLLRRMTVAENAAYPLEVRGLSAGSADAVSSILRRTGLAEKAASLPESLTHGERMMLTIARAFISQPMIVLADEPFAPLDPSQREIALSLFKEAQARGASVTVFTQHPTLGSILGARTLDMAGEPLAVSKTAAPVAAQPSTSPIPGSSSPSNPPSPADGKKIRITSIGS